MYSQIVNFCVYLVVGVLFITQFLCTLYLPMKEPYYSQPNLLNCFYQCCVNEEKGVTAQLIGHSFEFTGPHFFSRNPGHYWKPMSIPPPSMGFSEDP